MFVVGLQKINNKYFKMIDRNVFVERGDKYLGKESTNLCVYVFVPLGLSKCMHLSHYIWV